MDKIKELEEKIEYLQAKLFNYRYSTAIAGGATHEQAREHANMLESQGHTRR